MAPVQNVDSADGTRIAYRASGEGEPIVLVHGSATSSADWAFVLPFLRDRFTVVTMDRRGRGRSGDAPDYSIDREAEDVLAVLEEVGAELLVGHSYGGMCSILAAGRTASLRRLVVYEPPIGLGDDGLDVLEAHLAAGRPDAALRGFLRAAGTSKEQFEAIRASPAWPVLLEAVPALPRELRSCVAWENPRGPIAVPTLFLRGEATAAPAYLDGFADLLAAFPHARQALIPGQLHVAHVFAAEVFADLVANFCSE